MGKDADLLEAARNGNLQVVEKILSAKSRRSGPLASLRRGPGANVQDSNGYTALHHAALNGHKDVVSLLLAHEASCNVQDSKGSTPLHLAAWAGHTEVVKTLLHQGPSVSNVNHQNKGGETSLHCASQYGHTEAAQLLLARGGDPTVPNLQAETALDLAAQYGRINTVEVLVRAHPDLLRPYTVAAASAAVFPHTPLHRASRNGHREVVKLLLARGHHVNVRTGQGAPLHEAALCGKVDVVRVLLEAGADAEVRNDRGHTVLDTIAQINTPITQEITNLIKYHGHLIELDDEDEDPGDPPSWAPPVWPPSSWSPLAAPAIPAASELGSPYENVLIPTIVHPEMSVEDGEGSRAGENRASSRASDRESRASDRESRASDRESRTSDRESRTSDRESRLSDRDGRTSVASRVSEATSDWSIYDVPPPPKTVGGGSDRGSISYRSQTSEGGEDDGVYEVPPPPRSCRSSSTSLRTSRDSRHLRPSSDELPQPATSPGSTSSSSAPVTRRGGGAADTTTTTSTGSKVVEPLPPPKPPRRSMCPPSPTPDAGDQDQGAYETIYFKGQDQSDYENVDVQQKQQQQLQPPPQPSHSRTRSSSATFTHTHAHDSSDSDYDTPRPVQPAHAHSNRMYSTISFKPVKSRRTSKLKEAGHVYENTIHRYENLTSTGRYHTLRERDHHHHHHRDHREQDLRDREHRGGGGGGGGGGSGGGGSGGGGEQQQQSQQQTRDAKDGRDGRHHQQQQQQHPPQSSTTSSSSHHPHHHHHHHLLHHNDNIHNQDNARDHHHHHHAHQHAHHHRNETTASLRDRNENVHRIGLSLPRRPRAATAFCRSTVGRGDSSEDSDGEHRPRSLELREARAKQEKRPSRDIETETEPEEVLALEAGGSSCSLSSVSASLSDRSVSTDHIEEVKSDIPFAGLFRGSVTPMEGPEVVAALERPRSLTSAAGLRPGLDRGCRNSLPSGTGREQGGSGGSSGSGGVGLLSPLEEAEEWARINDIMASFGGGLARESVFMAELEHEFQTRLGLSLSPSQQGLGLLSGGEGGGVSLGVLESGDKTVGGWLRALGLPQYEDVFAAQGYDDTDFMNGGILESSDLRELGITQASHVQALGEAVSQLPTPFSGPQASYTVPDTVEAWLDSIRLPQYAQNFHKNGFGDMERVKKVWEIELTTVLEITRPGHRKRILASLGERPLEPELPPALNPHDLSLELTKLNSDISQLKEQLFNDLPSSTCRERRPPETASNTIRRSGTKKRSAPQPPAKAPRAQPSLDLQGNEQLSHLAIRDPSQLVVGAPNTLLTTWRHHPNDLVSNSVQYIAQYLGSTHVKELKGTESTMKSIQKLKKTSSDGTKVPKIILSVSYKGVKFMDCNTQTLVCEHEIRNIHCACQDAEDLSHFAYITKDLETKGHYCHVFRVQTRELATEIILTLGEAFEVAYQLALREQPYTNQSDEQKLAHGHTRSKSEHYRGSRSLSNGSSHTRSHSTVPQQMSIGGVSSSSAENLLSDSGNGSEKECGSRRDSVSSVPSNQSQMNGS